MLHSSHLSFTYPGGSTLSFPDVQLTAGAQALVLGPSGSGKSTLLGLWSGLLRPSSGEIIIGDTRVHTLSGSRRDRWRGQHIGLIYQQPRLLASQTVAANIALPRQLAGMPALSRSTINHNLSDLGIAHLADRYPYQCSVGEQQRVGILRALSTSPTLILADEPTSALDAITAAAVAELLRSSATASGATLAIVTHDERLRDLGFKTITLQA